MRDAQISGNLFDFPAALNERHGIFLELAVISPRIPALHFFHFRVFLLQSPSRVFEAGSIDTKGAAAPWREAPHVPRG